MIFAFDFDGTLCRHEFPKIGEPNLYLIEGAKEMRSRGAKLILWTCREGQYLEDAIAWCKGHGLEFDAVNENVATFKTENGTAKRKIYANFYIDDRALTPEMFKSALKAQF